MFCSEMWDILTLNILLALYDHVLSLNSRTVKRGGPSGECDMIFNTKMFHKTKYLVDDMVNHES